MKTDQKKVNVILEYLLDMSGIILNVSDINNLLKKYSFDTNLFSTLLLLEDMKSKNYISGNRINHLPNEFYVSGLTEHGRKLALILRNSKS
ncbi:hypothetical protein [Macrococcus bovicus]|uniref:Uncharacterized protein n=1 Tax=Macrococcus bovicus TaxID=69968 RepID=A0A4R6C2W2_9STAP|nr:hypothetical protein [Macrococcus bovicus]TDM15717.1 hypothetical protein ERX55_02080 [Macrococcus bovicus]